MYRRKEGATRATSGENRKSSLYSQLRQHRESINKERCCLLLSTEWLVWRESLSLFSRESQSRDRTERRKWKGVERQKQGTNITSTSDITAVLPPNLDCLLFGRRIPWLHNRPSCFRDREDGERRPACAVQQVTLITRRISAASDGSASGH